MPNGLTERASARQRILQAATALFYAEGIHAVGVDRVIVESDVAKATLYQQFRSKDELVAACLEQRANHWRANVADPVLASRGSTTERVVAVFDLLGKAFAAPGFRGCPFINAAAEYPDPTGSVSKVVAAHRTQVRNLFAQLLAELPKTRRGDLIEQLTLLYDGSMVSAQLGDPTRAAKAARRAARRLLESVG